MPNIYKINVSPKPLTNLTAVLTFTDDSTSTRTDWIEADTYYTITETTTKTLRSLTVSANNYITQTLETSDWDIDVTLSPDVKYVSKIKNNGVVYTLKDESVDGKIEGLANKTLSNVSSIDNNSAVATALNGKQATLVSGTNIKTVNNNSLLGSGNITIDSLPSQSGQSGKFLTTNGTTASWSTVSIPTVDQIFDSTSTNAQSGVAIGNELVNYVNGRNGNIEISNDGVLADITYSYIDNDTLQEQYSVQVGATMMGHGTLIGAMDYTDSQNLKEFGVAVVPEGFGISDGNQNVLLNISNNNLAVNGTEVALTTDIPDISTKQDTLVSGTNIKTVNNTSLLGSGNLSVGTVKSVNNTQPDNNGNVSLTIPTVNNATLTIQKNGTTVNTFTANASSDVTCNITVPTAVTDLSDASDYVTNTGLSTILDDYATQQWAQQQASSLYTSIQGWVNNQGYAVSANLANVATTGDYDDLLNKPTIPNAQIQSDWNQTDNTAVDFIKNKPTIPSGVIVDQVYDGTSTNAQSGVAIAGELTKYVVKSNGNCSIYNNSNGIEISCDDGIEETENKLIIDNSQVALEYRNYGNDTLENKLTVCDDGIKINTFSNGVFDNTTLSVSNSNLTVNGSEVALSTDIPTKISDLTDDTATNPVDKADTLTNLTATITELNYTDGVTSNIQTQFNTITGKIPSQASSSNQLADKAFVNSSVQTATANFRGNWDTWALVPTSASSYPADYAGSTTPTVNDYLVVQDASDYTGDTLEGTWRFKYTGVWSTNGKSGWNPEYQVNETPLTSAQLAALNSGITSSDVTLIGTALQPSDITNMVTTDTDQNITGTKTFVGSKKVAFKQSGSSDKLGFTLYNNSGTEKGYLEYNPTNTVDSVPLMTLGNYASASGGLTHVGFRKYSSISGASGAYNLLTPLISDARTPFNLTTTYTNFYLPLGFTDGTTTVKTAKSGMVDISSLLPDTSNFVTNTSLATTLSSYATQSWVGQQGYLTSIPSSYLQNTATGTNSLTLLGTATSSNTAINIGYNSSTTTGGTVAIGTNASTSGTASISIGANTVSSGIDTIAIGDTAKATANNAIQIGYGTNNTANKFNVRSYELLDLSTGLIPDARISSNIARTSAIPDISTKQDTLVSGTNIKTINSTSLLGSGNIDIDTIYWATYGTTTFSQIQTAVNNGNTVILDYNGKYLPLVFLDTDVLQKGIFSAVYNCTEYNATITFPSSWSNNSFAIAKTSDIPDISTKQDTLVSGTNIKTINNTSILGSGNISVEESFIAEYNTATPSSSTSFSDIKTAYEAGKRVYCNVVGSNINADIGIVPLVWVGYNFDTITEFKFGKIENKETTFLSVNNINSWDYITNTLATTSQIPDISTKQDTLVSGTNIKTINNTSILGSGNIDVLQNTATGTNALTLLGTATSNNEAINIGYGSTASPAATVLGCSATASGANATAIGCSADAFGWTSTAIGYNSSASGITAIAIGHSATTSADYAIQLGYGTNSTANSLQVKSYQLLDTSTGLIPDARISSNIARTSSVADTTLSNVSSISSSSAVKTALDTKVNTSDIWYDSTSKTLYIGVAQS